MLSQVRQEQEMAARDWRLLRFAVRCLPDAALLGSPFAQELCLRIRLFTVDPVVEGGLVDSREALVLGMETQLWLAWLRHIDALGVVMTGDFPAVRQRGPEIAPGMVFEDKHVHEAKLLFVGLGVATYGCRGALYPGIRRLTDGLAEFLYLRYAHPYFLAHPDDAPSPLTFDPVRYEEVPDLPPQSPLGLTDIDRADRVGEMKLLVIAFFQMIDTAPDTEIGGSDAKPARDVLRALLDAPDPLAAYLKALPETSEPDRPPDEPAPEPVTDPALAAPGVVADPRLMAEVSVQLLGTLVTDLEVAILTDGGPASFDDSAEGQAERVAALDLAARIEALLEAVPLQQKVAEGLAAQFPDLLDRVRAYGPRVIQLADAWSRSGWQYDESFTP
jgi:hypothetical protein